VDDDDDVLSGRSEVGGASEPAVTVAVAAEAPARRWNAWLSFAAAVLIVSGLYKILDALWAFKYDEERSGEVSTVVFERDLQSWGVVWLVVGVLLVAAGLTVVTGAQWARWFGIVAASATAVAALSWIYYQPLWTILSVTLSLVVVYALVFHGGSDVVAGPDRPPSR
jgi:hypothetical protein